MNRVDPGWQPSFVTPAFVPRIASRLGAVLLALVLAATPAPSEAIAPVLLLLVKQLAKNVAESMIKDAILSGLQGMGCKGIAIANALQALDLRRGGGAARVLGAAGLAPMPALPGMSGATGMAGMTGMTGPPGMPGMAGVAGISGMAGMAGGVGGAMPGDVAARMATLMPGAGQMPAGLGLDPAQMAMLASLQQSMAAPLSPQETLATIDELADLGFLPKAIQAELKECMVVLPASIAALGMGMGMMKPIVPKLRQARAELHALSPAEQDEVASTLADELAPLPAGQRAEFLEYLGSGFFPPRVVAGVKARLDAK